VKFGAMLVYEGLSDPDFLYELGQIVEELGFDSLWLADHVVVPTNYDSVYPYNESGKVTTVPFPEPMVSLGFLAAATKTVELGTAVLILPQRNPVLLAKQTATLDRLARGRLRLGIGVGWLREEFAALDTSFEDRGARTDEYIDVLRCLWTDAAPRFTGRYTALDGSFELRPKPAREKGVPIIVGGHSNAAAKRAGRRGDGFFPFLTEPTQLKALFDLTRTAAAEAGRSADDIELIAPSTPAPGSLSMLRDLGADHIIMSGAAFSSDIEGLKGKLGRFSERMIERAS
jgi:probable F420-dependent oxidoreductase